MGRWTLGNGSGMDSGSCQPTNRGNSKQRLSLILWLVARKSDRAIWQSFSRFANLLICVRRWLKRMNGQNSQACVVYLFKDHFRCPAIVKIHFLEASHFVERRNNGLNSMAIVNFDRRKIA